MYDRIWDFRTSVLDAAIELEKLRINGKGDLAKIAGAASEIAHYLRSCRMMGEGDSAFMYYETKAPMRAVTLSMDREGRKATDAAALRYLRRFGNVLQSIADRKLVHPRTSQLTAFLVVLHRCLIEDREDLWFRGLAA